MTLQAKPDKFEEGFDPIHRDMGIHVRSGLLNTGAVQLIRTIGQFLSVALMSRLLTPYDFGIFAMITPVYGFVVLFQDLGLGQATIQQNQITHEEVNAFFWINITVSSALTLLLLMLSPLVGAYYHEPSATALTAATAGLIFFGSLSTQHGAILHRRLQFRLGAILDVIGTLSSLLVSIFSALWLRNFWALYLGMATGILVPGLGVWLKVKWRPSAPTFSLQSVDMLKFGASVTGSNVANFISRNFDNVLIGRRWGGPELGLYDRAYKLLLFPLQRVVYPIATVMVPILSRLIEEPLKYKKLFLKTHTTILFTMCPGILWASMMSDELIPVILGPQWSETSPIFKMLSLAGIAQTLTGLTGVLYVSQARSKDIVNWGLFSATTTVVAFCIGLPYGALGVATAYSIAELIRAPISWGYAARKGPVTCREILFASLPFGVGLSLCCLTLLIWKSTIHLPQYLNLAATLLICYAVATLSALPFKSGRQVLLYIIKALVNMHRKFRKRRTGDD